MTPITPKEVIHSQGIVAEVIIFISKQREQESSEIGPQQVQSQAGCLLSPIAGCCHQNTCHDVDSDRLGQPCPHDPAACSTHSPSLSGFTLCFQLFSIDTPCSWYVPRSPLTFILYSHGFTHSLSGAFLRQPDTAAYSFLHLP